MQEFAARRRFGEYFGIHSCELHMANQLRTLRLSEVSGPVPGKTTSENPGVTVCKFPRGPHPYLPLRGAAFPRLGVRGVLRRPTTPQ
ncbi:hypothetical protein GCM10022284_56010 [Streptomyces hundungensis]